MEVLAEEIETIDSTITKLIEEDDILKAKRAILETIPGIGRIISAQLLALLPELGSIDQRKIAALVGLAPMAKESGIFKGYRRTGHGKNGIKPALFMAARNSKSTLREFYEKLIANGKKKMVALTALMRKIIVIANARVKNIVLVEQT